MIHEVTQSNSAVNDSFGVLVPTVIFLHISVLRDLSSQGKRQRMRCSTPTVPKVLLALGGIRHDRPSWKCRTDSFGLGFLQL